MMRQQRRERAKHVAEGIATGMWMILRQGLFTEQDHVAIWWKSVEKDIEREEIAESVASWVLKKGEQEEWGEKEESAKAIVKLMAEVGVEEVIVDAITATLTQEKKMCNTCMENFPSEKLVECNMSLQCSYAQCVDCILNQPGMGLCPRASCMRIHSKCPACREVGGILELSDARVTKEHVIKSVRKIREYNTETLKGFVGPMMEYVAYASGQLISE
jgi:hypothetical protein